MSEEDDADRTVIGGRLPIQGNRAAATRAAVPARAGEADRTVIGLPLNAKPAEPQRADANDRTIIGRPLPMAGGIQPSRGTQGSGEEERTIIGSALPSPPPTPLRPSEMTQPTVVATPNVQPPAEPRGPQHQALVQSDRVHASSASADVAAPDGPLKPTSLPLNLANTSNPFFAASAGLLGVLAKLRSGTMHVKTSALYDYALHEVLRFEHDLKTSALDQHDAMVGKYVLCGVVDDIVSSLPDIDHTQWKSQPLVARFFGTRDANVGFFQEAQKAVQSPVQRYDLLEFMLICLNLGFEGQYRDQPGGNADLTSIRSALLGTLRKVRDTAGRHQSVMWEPVAVRRRGKLRAIPIWAIFSMAVLAIVTFFGTLTTVLNRDGTRLAEQFYGLHTLQTPITLERAPGPVFVASVSQFERVSAGLNDDLLAGRLELSQLGNYIVIRVGNANLFGSGSSDVNPAFEPLAGRIARVLDTEAGAVQVVGYTDSLGAFETNMSLSIERAQAVAALLRNGVQDPSRLTVEGRGETDPIADNSTEAGRAKNRRVEIKLARDGTF